MRALFLLTIGWFVLAVLPLCAEESPFPSPEPTVQETQILEYINRFRADPSAEADRIAEWVAKEARFRQYDAEMFKKEMKALKPAQPLVFNLQLLQAARAHSQYMNLNNYLGHDEAPGRPGFTGADFGARVKAAGYVGGAGGENAYLEGQNPWETHASFVVDFGAGPGGMQPARGHRANLANGGFREIGVGIAPRASGRISTTHDMGGRKSRRLVGGVVYVDLNKNSFYDMGEGVGGVAISGSDGSSVVTWASGAYTLELKNSGKVTLKAQFSGASESKAFDGGDANLKFDWIIDQKILLDQADKLLAQAEAVADKKSPDYFKALVALSLGTSPATLDDARKQKVAELTKDVGTELAAAHKEVLDALKDFQSANYRSLVSRHRSRFRGTEAEEWFKAAELLGTVTGIVAAFEKQSAGQKVLDSSRRAVLKNLEPYEKKLAEGPFAKEYAALVERVKGVGK